MKINGFWKEEILKYLNIKLKISMVAKNQSVTFYSEVVAQKYLTD